MGFNIDTSDKPFLEQAMKDNPRMAKEVIGTLVALMEESFDPAKGIRWVDIAGELHKDLTYGDLIRGILRGSLDLAEINPDAFDALKIEVHPLSILSPRRNFIDGGMKRYNWRNHFRLPEDTGITEETVSKIFRKLLRYSKYVDVAQLHKALESNQLTTFRGLGENSIKLLPMVPALRYQKKHFGDLKVGTFMDDIGFLDCGQNLFLLSQDECPACQHQDLAEIGPHIGCLNCNAGFTIE